MQGMDADQVREFEEEIGMRRNPARDAQEALRAYQQAQGMVIENPDAPVAPDAKAMAAAADEELGGTWMGGPKRG
jgi:outer membrane protein assembly factor BamD (BamD/ComL family)